MTFPWRRFKQGAISVPIIVPLVVLMVFVVRGCDTAKVPNAHPPPGVTLPPELPTSAPADLTGVQLAGVDGTTTEPAVPDAGTSHLSGTVTGPQGPVAGADVRIEHLVGNHTSNVDVATDAAGHWDLANIAGGRYRVWAFLAPTLAQPEPSVFFLEEGGQRVVDAALDAFTGAPEVQLAIAPDPPQLGQPTSVVVRVTHRAVDSGGVVRPSPIAGASVTFSADGWSVTGSGVSGTNENGDATFVAECRKAGTNVISVTVRIPGAQPLASSQQVSGCVDPRSTSTATTAPTNTTPSTTTTAPTPN